MSNSKNKEYNNFAQKIEPHLFIIFGATGNLTRRKLFPAIYQLISKGMLKDKTQILGTARANLDDKDYRNLSHKMLLSADISMDKQSFFPWCDDCLHYQSLGEGGFKDYLKLANRINKIEKKSNLTGNRIFYLALPPMVFPKVIEKLGKVGLNKSSGWTRIVVEKPFGNDYSSAKSLNKLVHSYFKESQIYRIDHFLGKETVQNLMVFRFANTFFEHLWNNKHIESVEITMAEKEGIEGRSRYYEETGCLRDMVQNHLTQLLTLTTMEKPLAFKEDSIRNEKVKILKEISAIKIEDVIFGQYKKGLKRGEKREKILGYVEEPGVTASSKTETFVALKIWINNHRWKGVPFYLRTGKRLFKRLTQINIKFHKISANIFRKLNYYDNIKSNTLTITLQPDEGFNLQFQIKALGQPVKILTQGLTFKYSDIFGPLPDAYETLLLDVILGDQTLFVRFDEVEGSWKIYDELLKKNIPINYYEAGTWGPYIALKYFS